METFEWFLATSVTVGVAKENACTARSHTPPSTSALSVCGCKRHLSYFRAMITERIQSWRRYSIQRHLSACDGITMHERFVVSSCSPAVDGIKTTIPVYMCMQHMMCRAMEKWKLLKLRWPIHFWSLWRNQVNPCRGLSCIHYPNTKWMGKSAN